MKKFTILMLIVAAMVGCDAKEDNTATLTASQAKAMSQINNTKGKHNSKNGQSAASVGIQSTTGPGNMTCYTFNYDSLFSPQGGDSTIDCTQSIDLSSFGIDSLVDFDTSYITHSRRTVDGVEKNMVFYMGDDSKTFLSIIDPGFYKDDYYMMDDGDPMSKSGSLFYQYFDTGNMGGGSMPMSSQNTPPVSMSMSMYFTMIIWSADDGVSIDLSNLAAPSISKKVTSISIGSNTDKCEMTMTSSAPSCKIYVNVWNTDSSAYDQYTAEFNMNQMEDGSSMENHQSMKMKFNLMNSDNKKIGYLKMDFDGFVFTAVDLNGTPFK